MIIYLISSELKAFRMLLSLVSQLSLAILTCFFFLDKQASLPPNRGKFSFLTTILIEISRHCLRDQCDKLNINI